MVRPLVGIKPMSGAERQRRWRERQRNPEPPPPPPTTEELLEMARREIRLLQRDNGRLRAEASNTARSGYYATAPLHAEIKRLKGLLAKHGIEP